MHVEHAVLRPGAIEFRGYQVNLARIASEQDTLVVVPTGLGKTVIGALVLADAVDQGQDRLLLMAPTKPLVEQHARFLADIIANGPEVQAVTGATSPAKRQALWSESGIFCATPQVVQNDLVAGRLDLTGMAWVIFDEAHRASGEYPYTFLGAEAAKAGARRLGLTASPGHEGTKIEEVCRHLGLRHVEVRTPHDSDVSPYVQETQIEWETLPMPPAMARVSRRLHEALKARTKILREGKWLTGGDRPSRRALLDCAHKLQARARSEADVPKEVYAALSVQAQAMKLVHAIELAETQGPQPFRAFLDKMKQEADGAKPSKATLSILADALVIEAYHIAKHDVSENPKMGRTQILLEDGLRDPGARAIVFANYRDTCASIAKALADVPGLHPVVFVGQGNRGATKGLSQKEQQQVLDAFRAGEHNVLIATSVAEEGLDIPSTDLVVFYEPIASEIRSIQRRGRTGRHSKGRVVVLMTKGTQDEAAYWSARRKEQQMVKELQDLRRRFQQTNEGTGQASLPRTAARPVQERLDSPEVRIICDHREQAGGVVKHLHSLGLGVELKALDIGDFVLSDRVVVERKTTSDFVDSLLDQRIFEQLKALGTYPKPFVLIEGESLHGHRNVTPEALHGALASISIDFGVAIVQTKDAMETARFLAAVAKREQKREARRIAVRPGKAAMSDTDRLRHILAGFPRIDGARADALLAHFGDLASVFSASEESLAAVDGIGPKIAVDLCRFLRLPYTETVSREP